MSDTDPKTPSNRPPGPRAERERRLEQALRENLKRRKAAARSRRASDPNNSSL